MKEVSVDEAASYSPKSIEEMKKTITPFVQSYYAGNKVVKKQAQVIIKKIYRATFKENKFYPGNPSDKYNAKKLSQFGVCSFCTRYIFNQLKDHYQIRTNES